MLLVLLARVGASHKKRIWEFPPGRVSGSDMSVFGVVGASLERGIQVFPSGRA